MNIIKKLLILMIPFLFLAGATNASAGDDAPSIPPTKECLTLMDNALVQIPGTGSEAQERALFKPLVDAGCLTKNPVDMEFLDNKNAECSAALADYNTYLAPINRAMSPVAQRLRKNDNNLSRISIKLDRKIKKASKEGKTKLVKKLVRDQVKVNKKYDREYKKIILQNRAKVNRYDAPVFLAYYDLLTRECFINNSWFTKNQNALSVLTIYYVALFPLGSV